MTQKISCAYCRYHRSFGGVAWCTRPEVTTVDRVWGDRHKMIEWKDSDNVCRDTDTLQRCEDEGWFTKGVLANG